MSLLVGGLGLPTHLDGSGAGDLAATPLTLPLPLLPLFHPSSHLPFSFSPSFLYVLPSLTYPLLYPPPFPLLPLFPLPSYSLYLLPFPSVLPAFLPSFSSQLPCSRLFSVSHIFFTFLRPCICSSKFVHFLFLPFSSCQVFLHSSFVFIPSVFLFISSHLLFLSYSFLVSSFFLFPSLKYSCHLLLSSHSFLSHFLIIIFLSHMTHLLLIITHLLLLSLPSTCQKYHSSPL